MNKDQNRLLNMLKENKITENDYKTLSAALNKKSSPLTTVFSFLANPFQRIAGLPALLLGLMVMVLMSYLAVFAKVYFYGACTLLNATVISHPKTPIHFSLLLYFNMISWAIMTSAFLISTWICQQKRIRIIDFLGTTALARFPYLVLIAVLCVIRFMNPGFMNINLTKALPMQPSIMMMLTGGLFMLCLIWQMAMYFYALKESSGLVGKKLYISFIVSVILCEVISSPLAMSFI
jgi:hypothetical protein